MKAKKYKVECLSEPVFTITKTKILKKRLRESKKKPNKNKYGINRIQAELDRRMEQQANSYLESLREFRKSAENEEQTKEENGLSEEEYNEAIEIVREMKSCLAQRISEDPDFIEIVRTDSNKLKVIAEMRYENGEIYGYEIQNISDEVLDLIYLECNIIEFEVLWPGEIKTIELTKFIRIACQPEISFTFSNGVVRKAISRKEELKQIRETGNKINLRNYHVVPKKDSKPIPVVFIQE